MLVASPHIRCVSATPKPLLGGAWSQYFLLIFECCALFVAGCTVAMRLLDNSLASHTYQDDLASFAEKVQLYSTSAALGKRPKSSNGVAQALGEDR